MQATARQLISPLETQRGTQQDDVDDDANGYGHCINSPERANS